MSLKVSKTLKVYKRKKLNGKNCRFINQNIQHCVTKQKF